MWDLGSLTRDGTHTTSTATWVLNHWTVGEVPDCFLKNSLEQLYPGVIDVQHTFKAPTVISSDVSICISVHVKPSQLSE